MLFVEVFILKTVSIVKLNTVAVAYSEGVLPRICTHSKCILSANLSSNTVNVYTNLLHTFSDYIHWSVQSNIYWYCTQPTAGVDSPLKTKTRVVK